MTRVAELRAKWAEAGEEKEFDARFTKMAEVVMRQTKFSLEQAKCALEASNFSIERAILSFHDGPNPKRDEKTQKVAESDAICRVQDVPRSSFECPFPTDRAK